MFDDFIDWKLNNLDLAEKLELMGSEKFARASYDRFFDDWASEGVTDTELMTPEPDSFDFGKLWCAFELDVMSTLKAISPVDLVELQDKWADVFDEVDLRPIQSQLLTGKLLRDLSEKPERVLVKI